MRIEPMYGLYDEKTLWVETSLLIMDTRFVPHGFAQVVRVVVRILIRVAWGGV